jgi:hypothetical protein
MGRITVSVTNEGQGKRYQIIVRGHLEPHWQQWFNKMDIHNFPGGEASLTGQVVDQAMLHGLLIKIQDLGLALISVQCLESTDKP